MARLYALRKTLAFAILFLLLVAQYAKAQSYCIPALGYAGYPLGSHISSFTTTGAVTNISNTGSGWSSGGYGNFSATHSAVQYRGRNLSFSAANGAGSVFYRLRIWVDYNDDKNFEESEMVYVSPNEIQGSTLNGSFTIPIDIPAGSYRMRVIMFTGSSALSACGNRNINGEAEDYTLVVEKPCDIVQDFTFTTQAEVDEFGVYYTGCSDITVRRLIIGGANSDIHDLTPLKNITGTTGSLTIENNPDLTNLDGLSNLGVVQQNFTIQGNPSLTDIDGLNSLTSIGGSLVIGSSSALTNISGLNNLKSIDWFLDILGNPALTNIDGLNGLENTGALGVKNNPALIYIGGLSNLKSIGSLVIEQNDALTRLREFTSLTSIGAFIDIKNNAVLTDIDGLNSLKSIGTFFYIRDNSALNDITGFDNLTSIGMGLSIENNKKLNTVSGFNNLVSLGRALEWWPGEYTYPDNLRMVNNPALTAVSGFASLTTIRGYFQLSDNPLLASVTGFGSLTTLLGRRTSPSKLEGGHFQLRNCPLLVSVSGFGSLKNVFELAIQNTGLQNLDIFSNLTSLGGEKLAIEGNLQLTDISGLANINPATIGGPFGLYIIGNENLAVCNLPNFCTYLQGSGSRTIEGNKTTCIDVPAIQATCSSCPTGNMTFSSQADIDDFGKLYAGCNGITLHDVVIGSESEGTNSDITDLSPLQKITGITGELIIRRNPQLTMLHGLHNLENFDGGNLRIEKCYSLADISALSGITSVRYLNIRDNDVLQNLNGLHNIANITGSGSGLGYLYIRNNAQLTNLDGLQSLATIGNYIEILENPLLQNLNGLQNVTAINGNLIVQDNPVLTDISGLRNISHTTISGASGLRILRNPELAVCNLPNFCSYLSNPTNARTIQDNKEDCINEQALADACLPQCPVGDFVFNTQAQVDEFGALYAHCTDITLNNVLIGYPQASSRQNSDITDLTPLANITNLTGNLRIADILNLNSLNGLNNLTSIGGNLTVAQNSSLTNFNGLNNLTQIGGHLGINVNDALTNLDGLNSLESTGGALTIGDNPSLTNLDGLSNLTRIAGHLYLEENKALADISGLRNIDIATITGPYGLLIEHNPKLSVCNLPNFCTYLQGSGYRSISGNAGDCINAQAIINACFWSNITPDDDNILYVNSNVQGRTHTGRNWANAIPQLADALKWAKQQYDADNTVFDAVPLKLYVAKGTYKPLYRADDLDGSNPQDRDNAFVMVKNVHLYGGFAGNETTFEERNYATNPTILSGDIDGMSGLSPDDANHVVISVGEVGSALLDGFTVSGGYIISADGNTGITVNGSLVRYERGSGLSLTASSPQIRNVVFTGNRAYAGVVSHTAGSNATFLNTLFTGNTVQYGAVYNNASSPVFINSTFSGNTGTDNANNGVAMRNVTSHPKLYNTIIWGNHNANGSINNIFNSGGTSPTSIPEYAHSLVQGSGGSANWNGNYGADGGGNLDTDPLFTDAVNSNFTLKSGSPAINAGSNLLYLDAINHESYLSRSTDTGWGLDLAGNPRLVGQAIDMGVFESPGGALPVRWVAFQGYLNDDHKAILTWKTEEHNVSHYEAERSPNGRDFILAGNVPAGGTGSGNYSLTDPTPVSGTVYYRIRQVDLDGSFSYSRIISLTSEGRSELTAWPNPARETVTVEVGDELIGSRVRLISTMGIVLQEIIVKEQVFSIRLNGYPAGVYLLHTADGKVVRVVKE